ncbi:uncharacterized protein LOC117108506 [Anneissia japonica]|uniref:uncharacterized protein LOC117108506 n=1 Tax=Anneissia japonica TaxID=1529436 RepID=UPI00142559DF|nr:uncharacterized protein LOC117108506 [Anneissia japonica]
MESMKEMYVRVLREFFLSTYGPSLNKCTLADDTVMHEAYKEAQKRGTLPFNRTKVLILGDHAAGKTSTCRRLQGMNFRQDEPSTIGIETKYAKANISDVNSKWHEVRHTPLNDNEHEKSAAWWAVSHLRKQKETETKRTGSTPRIYKVSVGHLFQNMFYKIIYIIPILITFLFGGFKFGFGLVVWIYISSLMLMIKVNGAYRFGSAYIVAAVLIDSAMSIDEYTTDFKFDFWNDMSTATIISMYSLVAFLTGVLLGTGCRTGICIAFCFMVHPKQNIENATESLFVTCSKAYFTIKICLFAVTTTIIHMYVQGKIMSMRPKNCILTLGTTIVSVTVVACIGRRYYLEILSSLCIAVIASFTTFGVTVGKKFVVYGYIPQIYIIKKCIGFLAGICIGHVCGWELADLKTSTRSDIQYSLPRYFFNLFLFLAPITAYILYEWFAYTKVKNTSTIPLEHVRKSIEATMRNESYLDAIFSIWDFAGQEIYYNTHHLFMSKQGVYLILFNAIEAALNPVKQIKRLQFWLQSVAMHAEAENIVVILVGTRRKSVNDKVALLNFVRLAHSSLYKRFSEFLVFHPSGSLFFFTENTLQADQELDILREVICSEIRKLTFFNERFLIKYLLFNKSLKKFRLQKRIITSLQDILEEVKSTGDVISQNELIQFLNYFDRSGDVIYIERDELLRHYVICDPQMLVDILTILVNVPECHKRDRKVASLWQKLEDTGIVDSRLLEHICEVKGIWKLYPYIIRFLVGTHLLFPLSVTDQVDQVGTFFLSCRLPKINLISNLWNINDDMQDVFYFDLPGYLPEFIFLRLIAKCCEVYTWDKIYYNAARFRTTYSCLFLINTHVFSGSVNLHDRDFIKVSINNEDPTQVIRVLREMITFVKEIIYRDFNTDNFQEQYICGPVCERCSSLDTTTCLVNLIVPDNNDSILDGYRPDQYHKVILNPKLSFMCYRAMNDQV